MSDEELFSGCCRGEVLGGGTGCLSFVSFVLIGCFIEDMSSSSSDDCCDGVTE